MKIVSLLWEMRSPRVFVNQHIRTPLHLFLNRVFTTYRQKTNDSVLSIRELLFKAGVIALITSCVVWISVFLYVAFYYSYMPNIAHFRPVHLQFKSCDEAKGICSFPSSHVELTKRQQLLMVGQPYRIKLALEMPESEANRQLGMFLCCIELRAKGGYLVADSCRAGILPYRSELLTFMMTVFYSPLFLTGFREEKSTVEVELFSDYEDDQEKPVTDVYIEIQSRHIQFYSAKLFVDAHFSGLRYIMFHWPTLSAVVGISTNLLFVAFICALSWYHLQYGMEGNEMDPGFDMKRDLDDPFIDSEELQESSSIEHIKKDDDDFQFDDPIAYSMSKADPSSQVIKLEGKEESDA